MSTLECRPASFQELRAFLREHAGRHVEVTVDGPDDIGFASIRAHGLLDPIGDVEQLQLHRLALRDPDYDDPEFIASQADFRLLDDTGNTVLEISLLESLTADLELGTLSEIWRGDLATRQWVEVTLVEPTGTVDDNGAFIGLPDWQARIRVTEWAQRPIRRLVEEMTRR